MATPLNRSPGVERTGGHGSFCHSVRPSVQFICIRMEPPAKKKIISKRLLLLPVVFLSVARSPVVVGSASDAMRSAGCRPTEGICYSPYCYYY